MAKIKGIQWLDFVKWLQEYRNTTVIGRYGVEGEHPIEQAVKSINRIGYAVLTRENPARIQGGWSVIAISDDDQKHWGGRWMGLYIEALKEELGHPDGILPVTASQARRAAKRVSKAMQKHAKAKKASKGE
jgi:hypothetical protein